MREGQANAHFFCLFLNSPSKTERAIARMRKAEEAAELARQEEERLEREAEEASRRCDGFFLIKMSKQPLEMYGCYESRSILPDHTPF